MVSFTDEEKMDAVQSIVKDLVHKSISDLQARIFIVTDNPEEAAAILTAYAIPSLVGMHATYALMQTKVLSSSANSDAAVEKITRKLEESLRIAAKEVNSLDRADLRKSARAI